MILDCASQAHQNRLHGQGVEAKSVFDDSGVARRTGSERAGIWMRWYIWDTICFLCYEEGGGLGAIAFG